MVVSQQQAIGHRIRAEGVTGLFRKTTGDTGGGFRQNLTRVLGNLQGYGLTAQRRAGQYCRGAHFHGLLTARLLLFGPLLAAHRFNI